MSKLMYSESSTIKIIFKKISFDYKVLKRNSLNIYQTLTVKILAKNTLRLKSIVELANQISLIANVKMSLILDFLKELELKKILINDQFYKLDERYLNFKSVDDFLVSFNIVEGKNSAVLAYNSDLDLVVNLSNFKSFSEEAVYIIDPEIKTFINTNLLAKDKIIEKILTEKNSEYSLMNWHSEEPYLLKNDKITNVTVKFKVDLLYEFEENEKSKLLSLSFSDINEEAIFDFETKERLLKSSIMEKTIVKDYKPDFLIKLEKFGKIAEQSSELRKSNEEIIIINQEIEDKVVNPLKSLKIERDTTPEQAAGFKAKKAELSKIKSELEENKRKILIKNKVIFENFQNSIKPEILNSRFKKFEKYMKTHPEFFSKIISLEKETNTFFEEHTRNLNLFDKEIIKKGFEFSSHFSAIRIRFENFFMPTMEALSNRQLKTFSLLKNDSGILAYILKKANVKLSKDSFEKAGILKDLLDYNSHQRSATPTQIKAASDFLAKDIEQQREIVYSIVSILEGIQFTEKELDVIESKIVKIPIV